MAQRTLISIYQGHLSHRFKKHRKTNFSSVNFSMFLCILSERSEKESRVQAACATRLEQEGLCILGAVLLRAFPPGFHPKGWNTS